MMKIILAIGILASSFNVSGQAYFHFSGNQKRQAISFKFYRNLIVIPVMINGKGPFNFVLDSGVGVSTITDPSLQELLKLQIGKKVVIKGLGDREAADAFLTSGILMNIRGIESLPLTLVAFKEDPFFLSTYLGVKVHGILGYEFFSSFIVKINYVEKIMTVFSPGTFHPGKKYESLHIELISNKPFVKATCIINDSPIDVNLLLDTGAGFPLSLESYTDHRLQVPDPHLQTQLGLGLNGIIHGSLARINELQLGSFKFSRIVTAFPDYADWETKTELAKRNGSIGNFLLKRFSVVFDYNNERLFLKPNPKFRTPFEYDRVGIELVGGGDDYNHFVVFQVKPNSPAAHAGIIPDDELIEINFQTVKKLDLGNIDNILSDPTAKSVMLKIRRGEDFLYMFLKMRDLI
jgi:hypothetical protein